MRRVLPVVLAALAAGSVPARAPAATSVEVLASDPAGEEVTLGPNQNFYLRLGYRTDEPTHLWVRPYFRGEEVAAGSSPSRTYTGGGEALGWFFLMHAGDEVDEIRVLAGDGSRGGTHQVASHRVRVIGASAPAAAAASPDWLVELRARDEAAAREERASAAAKPVTPGDVAFFTGFMLAALGLGLLGLLGPACGMWRWTGAWRLGAALPAAWMAFVVLRILVDTSRDPTSHNLWPFELLYSGALSAMAVAALLIARRLARTSH